MVEYLEAVVGHLWQLVPGLVAGVLWLVAVLFGKDREERLLTRMRPWFGLLAFAFLSWAQFLAWQDTHALLKQSEGTVAAQESEIARAALQTERARGEAAAKIARLEGRADAVDEQRVEARRLFDEERGRTESLQDDLRRQAVEAAQKPVATEAWLDDGNNRVASWRVIEHRSEKDWHGLMLVVQHSGPPAPVGFRVTCECRLEEVQATYIDLPTGIYTGQTKILGSNQAQVLIRDPLFRAESPLLVQLYSKEPVRVTAIDPL